MDRKPNRGTFWYLVWNQSSFFGNSRVCYVKCVPPFWWWWAQQLEDVVEATIAKAKEVAKEVIPEPDVPEPKMSEPEMPEPVMMQEEEFISEEDDSDWESDMEDLLVAARAYDAPLDDRIAERSVQGHLYPLMNIMFC